MLIISIFFILEFFPRLFFIFLNKKSKFLQKKSRQKKAKKGKITNE